MNIDHLSVSRKQVFDKCSAQYKYQYHIGVEKATEEPIYFAYGSIVHKIAQEYVNLGGARQIGEVAQDVLDGIIEVEPGVKAIKLPSDYARKLPIHLLAIQKLTERIGFDGKTEYEFDYDLDPPNKRCVVGFIDRLIQRGDNYWIIDYKTTKPNPLYRKNAKTIKDDLQLRTYARIVQKLFGAKAENIKAALYYVDGENLISAKYSQESLDLVEKELLETYLKIEQKDPDQVVGTVGDHCRLCTFNSICPFFNNKPDYVTKLGLE